MRKKSHEKKNVTEKSQIWVGEKVTDIKSFIFLLCVINVHIIVLILLMISKNVFVLVDVLRPGYQFSV